MWYRRKEGGIMHRLGVRVSNMGIHILGYIQTISGGGYNCQIKNIVTCRDRRKNPAQQKQKKNNKTWGHNLMINEEIQIWHPPPGCPYTDGHVPTTYPTTCPHDMPPQHVPTTCPHDVTPRHTHDTFSNFFYLKKINDWFTTIYVFVFFMWCVLCDRW